MPHELWLYKISTQWKQQIRQTVFQDESVKVGVRGVSSVAYVVAQNCLRVKWGGDPPQSFLSSR